METQRRDRRYTYKDYMSWSEDERWETIDGVAYMLEDGRYIAKEYGETDSAPVSVLEGCVINLIDVFSGFVARD